MQAIYKIIAYHSVHILVMLSVNAFCHFSDSGAIHLFGKMNIDSLKIGDYLGIFLFLCIIYGFVHYLHYFLLFTHLIPLIAAIGAKFAATDSVCTLQV